MVSVSFKKNLAYWNRGVAFHQLRAAIPCLPRNWKTQEMFWGEIKACLQALISYLVAYIECNSGKKHGKILESQSFLKNTIHSDKDDRGWGEMHLRDFKNICRNLKCGKQSYSWRKQESEGKRHLPQPVAKGPYSNSCEIMGSGETSRWYVKGEHGWAAWGETTRVANTKTGWFWGVPKLWLVWNVKATLVLQPDIYIN